MVRVCHKLGSVRAAQWGACATGPFLRGSCVTSPDPPVLVDGVRVRPARSGLGNGSLTG
jgi:hypothetical protein